MSCDKRPSCGKRFSSGHRPSSGLRPSGGSRSYRPKSWLFLGQVHIIYKLYYNFRVLDRNVLFTLKD